MGKPALRFQMNLQLLMMSNQHPSTNAVAPRGFLIGVLIHMSGWCVSAQSQTLSEQVLGSIDIQGSLGGASIVSPRGNNLAVRERLGTKERYVTLQGPGPQFDRIITGAVWIEDRLVYYGEQGGKYYLVDGMNKVALDGTPTSPLVLGRVWPAFDRSHYLTFTTNGKSISWYADGIKQPTRFDRLNNALNLAPPASTPIFVATKNCVAKVVGHAASAKANWDLVHWTWSSADGSTMYVYGETAGRMMLNRNGVPVFKEPLDKFLASRDGKKWIAAIDRSTEQGPRLALIEDGNQVAEVNVDLTRHATYLASNGSTWVWKIYDEDYIAVTLKQPGKPDRRLAKDPLEYYLSEDGSREAYLTASDGTPPRVEIVLDGKQVSIEAGVAARSFRFGPGSAFAFEARDAESKSIVSHLGRGPTFDELSTVLFLSDGRPVYAARRGPDKFVVVGSTQVTIPAENLYDLITLRMDGSNVKVLGTRGTNLVAFTIAN